MENQNENFDELKKLLALKTHELPPPGYFNKLPGEVISRIRAERTSKNQSALSQLDAEAPWLMRFWRSLEGKPVFAGAFGAAICALALGAILFAEKPPTEPAFAGPRAVGTVPVVAATPASANGGIVDQPGMMIATNNSQPPSLFDYVPSPQTAPASTRP